MARPSKDFIPDLTKRINITFGVIERLKCPSDKKQVFMRDSEVPGMSVRVTSAGTKSFVYEAKMNGINKRRTIGGVETWTIEQARNRAREFAVLLDKGVDPLELERAQIVARDLKRAEQEVHALIFESCWNLYIADRKPYWGRRHHLDHLQLCKEASVQKKGSKRKSVAGPIHPFMQMRLVDITPKYLETWAKLQAKTRPTYARLGWRCLKAFYNWCLQDATYAALLQNTNPAKSNKIRESLGKPEAKKDVLLKEQLPAWFKAVQNIQNPVVSAYLQVLLLTGARPGEVLELKWTDRDLKWRGLKIRDKVEGERTIPLTPYVSYLLDGLPKRNQWVFSSPRADRKGKHMSRLDPLHSQACKVAGIEGLTLHGLRRSFRSLTEWLEVPVGIVAQVMGHKASATAEKHYTVRPLDLLRMHHEKIETWILDQASIELSNLNTQRPTLNLVANTKQLIR